MRRRVVVLLLAVLAAGVLVAWMRWGTPSTSWSVQDPSASDVERTDAPPTLVGAPLAEAPTRIEDLVEAFRQAEDEAAQEAAAAALRRHHAAHPGFVDQLVAWIRMPWQARRADPAIPDWHLLFTLLSTLGPDGAEALASLVRDPPPEGTETRRTAILALLEMGEDAAPAIPALLGQLEGTAHPRDAWNAVRVLGSIGPDARDATPRLVEALSPPVEDGLAGAAAEALLAIEGPTPEVLATLRAAIDDEDTTQRAAMIVALKEAGPAAAPLVDLLVPLLDDLEMSVRIAAADVLGAIGVTDEAVVEALRLQLESEEPQRKVVVARALARLGPAGETALVEVALEGEDVTERLVAMQTLARADALPAEAATPLQWIARDEALEHTFRRQATGLLGGMGPWPEGSEPIRLFVQLLDEPALRSSAMRALARHPDPAVRAHLLAWAERADDEGRFHAGAALRGAGVDRDAGTELLLEVAAEAVEPRWAREALVQLLAGVPWLDDVPPADPGRVLPLVEARLEAGEPVLVSSLVHGLAAIEGHGERVVPLLLRALDEPATQWTAAYGLAKHPAQAPQSVPRLLDAYLRWGRSRAWTVPRPLESALVTLGPRWSGTAAEVERVRREGGAAAEPYLDALASRIVR